MKAALTILAKAVRVREVHCNTHSCIMIQGIEASDRVVTPLAIYLVGAISSCIDWNMEIRRLVFSEGESVRNLYREVISVIGADNDMSDKQKATARNAWIWEGISHLIFHLSRCDQQKHPPGRVLRKSFLKLDVSDHGLDLIALYGPSPLGVSIGECKAYLDRIQDAIGRSAARLKEVDRNERDSEIRQVISQMRGGLPRELDAQITGLFWRDERAYFPMVCCEANCHINWHQDQECLGNLDPPLDHKFLVPVAIENPRTFFDSVADAMRTYCSGKPQLWGRDCV